MSPIIFDNYELTLQFVVRMLNVLHYSLLKNMQTFTNSVAHINLNSLDISTEKFTKIVQYDYITVIQFKHFNFSKQDLQNFKISVRYFAVL